VNEKKSEMESTGNGYYSAGPVNPQHENRQLMYRYSDQELEEFRVLITARIESARKELQFLQEQMLGKDNVGLETARFSMEDGGATLELEQQGQFAARQIKYINNLENALLRIQNKTYGICRETGKLIDKARLKAVPHATLSIEAKRK
jgi:RNA polymerase-binding transcription factor DksA